MSLRRRLAISNLAASSMFVIAIIIGGGVTAIILDAETIPSTSTTTLTVFQVASSSASSKVTILGNGDGAYFSPDTVTVVIGMNNTITWTNNGTLSHTVTATDGSFNSGNLEPGQSWTYTFTTPGTYNYYCVYHVWMKGTVIVEVS